MAAQVRRSSQARRKHANRKQRRGLRRIFGLEALEDRRLLAVGPPTVEEVLIGGQTWQNAFTTALSANGEGNHAGFRLTAETADKPLPWSHLDRLSIRFNESVHVEKTDLRIQGVNAGNSIPLATPGFQYDDGNFTATWTFAQPLSADKYAIRLLDRVTDLSGHKLDGEGALPSGNDVAGGDFVFQFSVVPGDGDQSGLTDLRESLEIRDRMFATPASSKYSTRYDFDGSGVIDLADSLILRGTMFHRLPEGSLDLSPPSIHAALARDTAPDGLMNADGLTSDPRIAGSVTDPSGVQSLVARLDGGLEWAVARNADGSFVFNPVLALDGSADGYHVVRIVARDQFGNESVAEVPFTLDTLAPSLNVQLSIASDTGTLADGITGAGFVAVVGESEPALTARLAELNRTALVGANSRFEFPDVPLSVGDNLFTFHVFDAAGNQAVREITIARTDAELAADPVLAWNQVLLEAIRLDATPPPQATRGMAMVNLAIFDSVAAIEQTSPFLVKMTAEPDASPAAAIAASAHRVLSYLFPGQASFLDANLASSLDQVPDGVSEDHGVALGEAIGDAIIAIREHDGWNDFVDYTLPVAPGNWQPTAPMYELPLVPHWGDLPPFAMTSLEPFLSPGPPELTSEEYANSVNEVMALGRNFGSTRTADQTQIARFWADGAGTYTPPGHWLAIARQIAQERGNSTASNARLFAALSTAVADAAIISWKAKYTYDFWRPIDAIQQAHLDNNPLTIADPTWQPLLITPPFPEYTSGHATFSGAASRVLTLFLGENVSFTTTSLGLPGVQRSFSSFDEAAKEAARSRIYGGIHYDFSDHDGMVAGQALADYVVGLFRVNADQQPPTVIIDSPPADSVSSNNITLTGRATDNLSGVASLEYQIDAGPRTPLDFNSQGQFSLPTTLPLDGSADGVHTIQLFARDSAGNDRPPVVFHFTLDTVAPQIDLTSPTANQSIDIGSHLVGTVSLTGSRIASLSYNFDGGNAIPVAFDEITGAFDEWLSVSGLNVGDHTLTVKAVDAAGNVSTTTRSVRVDALAPFTILGVTPSYGAKDVGTTFRPQVFFTRAFNPATLHSDNFFATDPSGAKLPATIVPSEDHTFAWLFFTNPLPGGSTITIHVLGDTILAAADSVPLDPDFDGVAGGTLKTEFTTVSLAPLAGTSLRGRIFDPGPDFKPMTFDDMRAGPDGVPRTPDDVFLLPIAGVKIFIIGLEDQVVFSGADGSFHFDAVPSGKIKLVIDGRTATNAPANFFFPEMVMDLEMEVGQVNTVMGTMGSFDQREANRERTELYLPRLHNDIFETVSDLDVTLVGLKPEAAPNLTPQQRQFLTLEVQPGSLIGHDGQPITGDAARVGISTVPPQLVREMLPPGLIQHTFDITIQASDAAVFNTPLKLTFPNIFNSEPGTKLNFLSFDHTTGMLVIEGTATVSADGLSVTTDPGTGITKPGWHGLTPPGGCAEPGGPPPEILASTVTHEFTHEPERFATAGGDAVPSALVFPELTFVAPQLATTQPMLPPPPGCAVPPRRESEQFLTVEIDIDGPASEFLNQDGDLPLRSQTFTLAAGSNEKRTLGAEMRSFAEMFGPSGVAALSEIRLYAAIVKVKEIEGKEDGTRVITNRTYYVSRLIDVTDNSVDTQMQFPQTLVGASVELPIDLKGPAGANLELFGMDRPTDYGSTGNAILTFSPSSHGAVPGLLRVSDLATDNLIVNLSVVGEGMLPQRWHFDVDAMVSELASSFLTSMTDDEKFLFGRVVIDGDPDAETSWEFDTAMANAFIQDTLARVELLLAPYDSAIDRASTASSDAVLFNQFSDSSATSATALGEASKVDRDRATITNLVKNRSKFAPLQQQYILSQSLNPIAGGHVDLYVSRYFSQTDASFTYDELRNVLAKTIAHELGHEFGLTHTNKQDGTGTDIMTQGKDFGGSRRFIITDPALRIALGLFDLPGLTTPALDYFQKYRLLGGGDAAEPDDDPNFEPLIPFDAAIAQVHDALTEEYRSRVDFGSVSIDGEANTINLLLANVGDQPLTLGAATIFGGNGQFTITGLSAGQIVQPGESVPFTATFRPNQLQDTSAVLQIANSGFDSALTISLQGRGARAGGHGLVTSLANNFGGAVPGAAAVTRADVATITNFGLTPLAISGIQLVSGAPAFALTGIPADLATHPIVLAPGESFSFDAAFTPDRHGLLRGMVHVTTDSATTPTINVSLVGTGVTTLPIAQWGNDYVAVTTRTGFGGQNAIFLRSDNAGHFSMFLPGSTPYEITIFDPQTGLVAHGVGTTARSGNGTDLTATLVFQASTAPDTDADGLPDDIEAAVQTSLTLPDTDADGVDDFTEIQQGLNPLTGRAFTTGVVASVDLEGTARQVVLEGSTLDPAGQLAYVATGDMGLAIVDTTNFQQPIVLSQLDLPGEAVDVAVDSQLGLAAIANSAGGLHVVDVSNPRAPVLLQTIVDTFTPVPATQVEVVDGVAYTALGGNLVAYDLTLGERIDTLNLGINAIHSMAREGSFLYTIDASNNLRAIDLSSGTMTARGSLAAPGFQGRVFVGNGVAYIGFGAGFGTIDVSNPDNFILLSGQDALNLEGRAVVANGSGLAVGVGNVNGPTGPINGLDLFDVSDPTNTAGFLGRHFLPDAPQSVAIGGGIAYVADGDGGLVVVNYMPFDNRAQSPTATIATTAEDLDLDTPGVQVLEGTTLFVRAIINDDVQVRNVELLVNGQVVRNDVAFPFDLTALALGADGATRVQLRATDTGGNTALSNELVFMLLDDETPPTIQSITPAHGVQIEQGLRRVAVEFSESMDLATVTQANFHLTAAGVDAVFGTDDDLSIAYSLQTRNDARTGVLTFPALSAGKYRLSIDASALTDRAGNPLGAGDLVNEFTLTASSTGFGIEGLTPDYGAGNGPLFVVPGDLDGDGDDDLVTTNRNVGTVSILLSDGLGGVESRMDVAVGPFVQHAALGDIDGDGDLDLVTANDGSVSVLTNDGVGGFGSRVDVPVGTGAIAVALGDVDGDDDLDLMVSSTVSSQRTISVFRNNGFGAFGSRQDSTLGFGDAIPFAIGDLDGDGDLDILTNTGAFLRNNGSGSFMGGGPVAFSPAFRSVTLGDLDGDGDLDVAGDTTILLNTPVIAILFNNGTGTFGGRVDISSSGAPVLQDIDQDGDLDLLARDTPTSGVAVFRNNGAGVFGPRLTYFLAEGGPALAAADLDGDGDLDLAGNNGNNALSFLLNDGTGGFGTPLVVLGSNSRPIGTGDLDGDGDIDVVIASNGGSFVSVFQNNGDGVGYTRTDVPVGSAPNSGALADIDGDGDLDVAITRSGNNVTVLFNDGAGNLGSLVSYAVGTTPQVLRFGDVDGDGDLDIITANSGGGGTITILRNDGAGGFGSRTDFTGVAGNNVLVLGDVDGDGDLDLITSNGSQNNFNTATLFRNDGSGAFTAVTSAGAINTGSGGARSMALGDIDGDGDLDFVSTGFSSFPQPGIIIVRNDGTGNFPQLANPGSLARRAASVFSIPTTIALADVDGDGDLDIVATNNADNTASVIKNDGTGNFGVLPTPNVFVYISNAIDYMVGPSPATLLGDVDGDGDLDLLSARLVGSGSLTTVRNDGQGRFGRPQFPVGWSPAILVTGDFTGDGIMDIVTRNHGTESLPGSRTLLAGDGTGGFATMMAIDFTVVGGGAGLVAGDIDGDGNLNLVTGNALGDVDGDGNLDLLVLVNDTSTGGTGPAVWVYIGDGLGGFAAPVRYAVAATPQSLMLADFDGDGDLDVVTANSNGGNSTASVLFNDGSGGFGSPYIATTNSSTAVGDIDGDGDLDIVARMYNAGVRVLRNNGANEFTIESAASLGISIGGGSLMLGDLDGDGDLDAVINGRLTNRVARLLNDGTGSFGSSALFDVGARPEFVVLGDLDGDGDLDLATANSNGNNVTVLLNDGTAGFGSRVDYAVGASPRQLALGDLDGDNDLDLVSVNANSNNVSILLNDGLAGFAARTDVETGNSPLSVALGDLDGDNDLDLVVANSSSSTVSRLLNDGQAGFGSRSDVAVATNPGFVLLGDADGDGDLDVVTSHGTVNTLTLLRNDGAGTLGSRLDQHVGGTPTTMADIDSDGDLDIISSGATLGLLRNDGHGIFAPRTDYAVGSGGQSVTVGDFDGDGDMDFAVANSNPSTVTIWFNQGEGVFGSRTDVSTGSSPQSIVAADMDGDGDVDLITGNGVGTSSSISVLFNDGAGGFLKRWNYIVSPRAIRAITLEDMDGDGDLDIVTASFDDSTVNVLIVNR